jgi:hypothetical protein
VYLKNHDHGYFCSKAIKFDMDVGQVRINKNQNVSFSDVINPKLGLLKQQYVNNFKIVFSIT